ncbi:hypothetical protein DFH06DRAFT_1134487 [Mycena polygramma]|nr:hypothetical protein DFH06DRAFT_1134487 [Mycena polygramma]
MPPTSPPPPPDPDPCTLSPTFMLPNSNGVPQHILRNSQENLRDKVPPSRMPSPQKSMLLSRKGGSETSLLDKVASRGPRVAKSGSKNQRTDPHSFRCPFPSCGRRFSVESNMKSHLRSHGPALKMPSWASTNFTLRKVDPVEAWEPDQTPNQSQYQSSSESMRETPIFQTPTWTRGPQPFPFLPPAPPPGCYPDEYQPMYPLSYEPQPAESVFTGLVCATTGAFGQQRIYGYIGGLPQESESERPPVHAEEDAHQQPDGDAAGDGIPPRPAQEQEQEQPPVHAEDDPHHGARDEIPAVLAVEDGPMTFKVPGQRKAFSVEVILVSCAFNPPHPVWDAEVQPQGRFHKAFTHTNIRRFE